MDQDSENKSKVKNQHDADIFDEVSKNARPKPERNSGDFLFFSNATPDLLMKGIKIKLNLDLNHEKCKTELLKKLIPYINNDLSKMDVIVYLAGGIPFLGGTLKKFYESTIGQEFNRYIYGILIPKPHISNADLSNEILNICDIHDGPHKQLISPLYLSTDKGLCEMACLLGYLNNFGSKGEKLLKCAAATIHFPPLITCLNRIIERNNVTKRDVMTVCATFHTYFSFIIKSTTPPEQIFEYSLRCCNIITHIENIPDVLQISSVNTKKVDKQSDFLKQFNQPELVYIWNADKKNVRFDYIEFVNKKDKKAIKDALKDEIEDVDKFYESLPPINPKAIENANKSFASFSPIAPLSIRSAKKCSIVKGKEHCFLYLYDSPIKGSTDYVNILDPLKGKSTLVNIDAFAKEQNNNKIDDVANLIDPDDVEQIIMVCFDRSGSMSCDLNGNLEPSPEEPTRLTIATQYLTSFVNKTYGYRVPCILGLIAFNHELDYRCHLSPLIPDFEDKGLKGIEAQGTTHLWDVIIKAIEEIVEYSSKQTFPKAIKRIIVISDGENVESTKTIIDATKAIIDNKIILDSVLISETALWKELAVVSHISGGKALKPKDINEGMDFFELDAFQNVKLRNDSTVTPVIKGDRRTTPKRLTSASITNDFIQQAINCVEIDKQIINKQTKVAIANTSLSTPEHVCSSCRDEKIKEPRRRRILRELHYTLLVTNKELETYDPDLVVYTFGSNYDKWQVFLRSPQDSNYLGKWFSILVTFPPLYPIEAPSIQFISVPYNLNISSEGRICLDILEKGYIPSLHVVDILQRIKSIFLLETIELPLKLDVFETFLHDRNEYNRRAKESALKNGKDKYTDFLGKNINIKKDILNNCDFTFDDENKVPKYMISQISGRVFKDPVLVPSVNILYERNDIKQLIATNKTPHCIITGLPITESLKDIDELKKYLI